MGEAKNTGRTDGINLEVQSPTPVETVMFIGGVPHRWDTINDSWCEISDDGIGSIIPGRRRTGCVLNQPTQDGRFVIVGEYVTIGDEAHVCRYLPLHDIQIKRLHSLPTRTVDDYEKDLARRSE